MRKLFSLCNKSVMLTLLVFLFFHLNILVAVSQNTTIDIDWSKFELSNGQGNNSDGFWSRGKSYGDLKDVDNIKAFRQVNNFVRFENTARDKDFETKVAVEKYFWGKTNGIVMELGAVNGIQLSQSLPFERLLGWHRLLVDGNPEYVPILKTHINALVYSCAICEKVQQVHYVTRGAVSGILEFMNANFTRMVFGDNVEKVLANFSDPDIIPIQCLPLQLIFNHNNLTHINFFILDVEGGELNVLKSIDFNVMSFDVLSIETEEHLRPPGYEQSVIEFLKPHGYEYKESRGRNTWFVNAHYTPSVKPEGEPEDTYHGTKISPGPPPPPVAAVRPVRPPVKPIGDPRVAIPRRTPVKRIVPRPQANPFKPETEQNKPADKSVNPVPIPADRTASVGSQVNPFTTKQASEPNAPVPSPKETTTVVRRRPVVPVARKGNTRPVHAPPMKISDTVGN